MPKPDVTFAGIGVPLRRHTDGTRISVMVKSVLQRRLVWGDRLLYLAFPLLVVGTLGLVGGCIQLTEDETARGLEEGSTTAIGVIGLAIGVGSFGLVVGLKILNERLHRKWSLDAPELSSVPPPELAEQHKAVARLIQQAGRANQKARSARAEYSAALAVYRPSEAEQFRRDLADEPHIAGSIGGAWYALTERTNLGALSIIFGGHVTESEVRQARFTVVHCSSIGGRYSGIVNAGKFKRGMRMRDQYGNEVVVMSPPYEPSRREHRITVGTGRGRKVAQKIRARGDALVVGSVLTPI